jgi:hypothetical protein
VDSSIPVWTKCKPGQFYEKIVENCDDKDRSALKAIDADAFDADSGVPPSTAEEKTFDSTNLLFGDNLALLYAQGAQMVGTPDTSFLDNNMESPKQYQVPGENPFLIKRMVLILHPRFQTSFGNRIEEYQEVSISRNQLRIQGIPEKDKGASPRAIWCSSIRLLQKVIT